MAISNFFNNHLQTIGIYADGMVLQQNTVNCIAGLSLSGKKVSLTFNSKTYETISSADGNWKIEFNPGNAGGPYSILIKSEDESIEYKNIFIGEVWLNCGQSNAQLPMERMKYSYPLEMKNPCSKVHMITIPISYEFNHEKTSIENPQWFAAAPDTIGSFSGTAYFFAKKLSEELGVHVGIINASQGGSPISAWMNYDSLKQKSHYTDRIKKWQNPQNIKDCMEKVLASQKNWDENLLSKDMGIQEKWQNLSYDQLDSSWSDGIIPGDINDFDDDYGFIWLKKEVVLSKAQADLFNSKKTNLWCGTIVDADTVFVNGVECGQTGYLYPPRRYEIAKGILHQGSNTVTIRVLKRGACPVRFYKEKPYCIFTDDYFIKPAVCRNIDYPVYESDKKTKDDFVIDLTGNWKKKIGCKVSSVRADEVFFEWEPSALYNAMLGPTFNYAINGALWYQGESDAGRADEYKDLLLNLMKMWREKYIYSPKDMNVIVVQLPNWAEGLSKEELNYKSDWAMLRAAQSQAVEEDGHAGLSVMIDAGEWNDLHPEKKLVVGTRSAYEALRLTYKKDFNKAPALEYCERKGKVFTVRMNCQKSCLKAFSVQNEIADFNKETTLVYGFAFADKDGKILEVQGKLISDTDIEIELQEQMRNPVELRYLWENNPWIVNLYNEDKLPALPFRVML